MEYSMTNPSIRWRESIKQQILIQIKDKENRVIYQQRKCELFPDYKSVLREAIAYGIRLDNLFIVSQNLDGLSFDQCVSTKMSFKNCSMQGVKFSNVSHNKLSFSHCDLHRVKFKNIHINAFHAIKCDLSKSIFRNCIYENSDIDFFQVFDSDLSDSLFIDSVLHDACISNTLLSNVVFERCDISDANFYKSLIENESWYNNIAFFYCEMRNCMLVDFDDLNKIKIWESNIESANGITSHFTKIENKYSTILYAIGKDLIWWRPKEYPDTCYDIFRGTLEDLMEEVENDFPLTLFNTIDADNVANELYKVIEYLKLWK